MKNVVWAGFFNQMHTAIKIKYRFFRRNENNSMKRIIYSLMLLFIFVMTGCQELAVENENSPDRIKALAEPGDVETLGSDTFTQNWERQWCGESFMLTTMSDEISSAWANWGMRDMSSEPRIAWNNDPSYSRRASVEGPWFSSYGAISDANDVLISIAAAEAAGSATNNVFTNDGIDVNRLRAFAKFNQAWAHSFLALMFDQAFIFDESVELEAVASGAVTLELAPYQQVMEAALAQMDEAIAIAQSNAFTITAADDWVYGIDFTNEDMVKLGNSFKAQWMAQLGRTPAEREAANWNTIMTLISMGITEDFAPIGDDDGTDEWDCVKFYGSNGTTWSRIDYRTLGPADESGGYEAWLATPLEDRLVFDVVSSDRRINGDPDDPAVNGKYTEYQGTNGPFPAARGTYHYSSHNHRRWQDYNANNGNGLMPYMIMAEMDMLMAEGLLRTGGSMQTVADLINKTRVPNGELNPAEATAPLGSSDEIHSHLDTASMWAKMKYEKRIETMGTSTGLAFFDDRGWGDLVTNTPYHFPVPGKELETLSLQLYTFGGGGEGSASKQGGARNNRPTDLHWSRTKVK